MDKEEVDSKQLQPGSGSNYGAVEDEKEHYSTARILAISAACIGFQVAWACVFALIDPLMTAMNLSSAIKTLNWAIAPISGFVTQPIIGYYSDRCKSQWGRRRPFIVSGPVIGALGILALFLLQNYGTEMGSVAKALIFLIVATVTYIAVNIFQGPARSLIGDLLPKDQQEKGMNLSSVMLGIASIITNLIGGIGYFINSESYSNSTTTITLVITAIAMVVTTIITCVAGKERPFTGELEQSNVFVKLFKNIFHMPKPMARAALALVFSMMAFYPFNTKATSFFSAEVFPPDKSALGLNFGLLCNTFVYIIQFLYGLVQGKVMEKVGLKLGFAVSQIVCCICLLIIFFTTNQWACMVLMLPLGISSMVINSVPYSIVGIVSSAEDMGTNLGVMNMFNVIGQQCGNVFNVVVDAIRDAWPWFQSQVGQNQAYIGMGIVGGIIATIASFFLIVPEPQLDNDGDDDEVDL